MKIKCFSSGVCHRRCLSCFSGCFMAWGQVISWGGGETSDKWCDSMAPLLMGTLNGKLTGNDKVLYLNKLKREFG